MLNTNGRRRWFALLTGVLLLTAPALAVGQTENPAGPELIPPVDPVIIDVDLRTLPPPPVWKPGDPTTARPRVMHPRPRSNEPQPALDQDPLAGPQAVQTNADFATPIHNFEGQAFSGVYPADPVGEVGPDYYVQMINGSGGTRTTFYNKVTTAPAVSFLLQSLAPVGSACRTGRGDPIPLYDHLAGRWLLSEFATAPPNALCIYISQTGDPISGGWFLYQINTQTFPDYPKYAVWPDAYYVNTNESDLSVYALDRENMLAGLTLRPTQKFIAPGLSFWFFQTLPPIDLDGQPPPVGSPAFFVRQRDTELHNPGVPSPTQDFVELWPFHVDWDTPANSTFGPVINIPVADFSSLLCDPVTFQCIPQPVGRPLDPLREAVMWKPQYRNFGTHQSIVGNFPVALDSPTHAGVRWFELRRVGSGPWTLHQQGTWAGPMGQVDPTSRWMAGTGMDKLGNIAIGYDVSSSAVFPGIRYTGRLAADPLGTMSQGDLTLIEGTGPSLPHERWGDYNSLNVDTEDDCTFWFTSMYGKGPIADNPFGDWATRIGSFKFDNCVTADLSITKTGPPGRVPTGRNMTYTLTVTNNGPDDAADVTVVDTLPASVTFVSATPSQGGCSGTSTVTCLLGALANGNSATIAIVVRPTQAGVITNVASITPTPTDPNTANNTDSVDTVICRITSRRTSIPCD